MQPMPFIVGVPRSGTTLVRLMLDAHPDLAIPAETHFLTDLLDADPEAPDPAAAFLDAVLGGKRWLDFHLDRDVLRERVLDLRPFSLDGAVRSFFALYAESFGKPRWGDKTPNYLLRMADIQALLPEARFVHLIRDGRDVALSITGLWWGPSTILEAGHWWANQLATARRQAPLLRHYLEVRYEDLLQEPEAWLRRMAGFLDLPWNPAMLGYHRTAPARIAELVANLRRPDGAVVEAEERRSYQRLVDRPPDAGHIGRWRTAMPEADRQSFRQTFGLVLNAFGYRD